ncbi:hypothetical protein DL98DRAFT_580376 [Cadophora sp. DSE1049]|nr:hypothetical protein DL98DRAFT_580376 [Cadophora sp. DSE1049]
MFCLRHCRLSLLCLALSALVSSAFGIGSTKQGSLSGGLTILSHNDLESSLPIFPFYYHISDSCPDDPKSGSGAILLGEESTFDSTLASCRLISESLWTPIVGNFFNGLNSSLSYQVYQGSFHRNQLFWISKDAGTCRAIDIRGKVTKVKCDTRLPSLCTQSAPVSTFNSSDTSAAYQITRYVGRQFLKGYRDFYVWKFLGVRYAAQSERYPPYCHQKHA